MSAPNLPEMENALLRQNGTDQKRDQHDDRDGAPSDQINLIDQRGGAESARTPENPQECEGDGAEHLHEQRGRGADFGHVLADRCKPVGHALAPHPLGIGQFGGLMNGVDDGAELVRQVDHVRGRALLARSAQQPFEQPGAIGVELGDALHVDANELDRALRRQRRGHDQPLQIVGTIGRPVAAGQ